MRRSGMIGIIALTGLVLPLWADDPVVLPITPTPPTIAQAKPAAEQPAPEPEPEPPPELSAQTQAMGPSGSGNPGAGHPQMVGDLNGGTFLRRRITFPTSVTLQVQVTETGFQPSSESLVTTTTTRTITVPSTITREVIVPLNGRGAFKVAENESPKPLDRVFANYNYFNNVAVLSPRADGIPPVVTQVNSGALNSSSLGQSSDPSDPFSGSSFVETVVDVVGFNAAPQRQRLDVHREVLGFEKLLFSDDFSVGVRVPVIQQANEPTLESGRLGDISVVLKYALINSDDTGNVLSGGLIVTAPTGEDAIALDGSNLHSTLLQPFVGYFVNLDQFFVQGFSAVIVPTDSRDSTLLTEDVGLGYRLYEDVTGSNFIRYVCPTVEGHLTTPLNHRGAHDSLGGFPDIFITTGAVHIGVGDRGNLTMGVGTPLTGPQPFDVEGVVQFNFRF